MRRPWASRAGGPAFALLAAGLILACSGPASPAPSPTWQRSAGAFEGLNPIAAVSDGFFIRDGHKSWFSSDGILWQGIGNFPVESTGEQPSAQVPRGLFEGGTYRYSGPSSGCDTNGVGPCQPFVIRSTDGRTWESGERLPGGPAALKSVVRFGPGFVAVGDSGGNCQEHAATWVSGDGQAWERVPEQPAFEGAGMEIVLALERVVVALGRDSCFDINEMAELRGTVHAWISPDGRTWSKADVPACECYFRFAAVGGGRAIMAMGAEGWAAYETSDGSAWARLDGILSDMNALAWDGARFVGVGAEVWFSADGRTWTESFKPDRPLEWVMAGPRGIVAGGTNYDVARDGGFVWALPRP